MTKVNLRPWKTLRRREVVNAQPWLRLLAEDVQLPDQRVINGFYTIEAPDYVIIVALTANSEVVIEHCYKHGTRRVALNLPAGYIERGEDPLSAAQRELREETGYEAASWQHLGTFTVDGNRGCGTAHLYLARGARQTVEPDSGDLEEIAIALMGVGTLRDALFGGEVAQLPVAAAIGMALVALGGSENVAPGA
jgi:ADP-ribose pyrophosphatase